jgi:hypothetical protein
MSFISGGTTIRADINQALIESPAEIGLIGAEVLPLLPVPAKSGQYLKVQTADAALLDADAARRSAGSEYARASRKFTSDNYDCIETGLEELLDDSFRADANRFFQIEAETARFLLRQVKLSHEKRVADLLFATTTPFTTADLSPTATYIEGNLATINAPADVAAGKLALNRLGYAANAVIMSANVYERVRRTTLLQNQFYGVVSNTGGRLLDEAQIAEAFGVDKVYIGRAAINSANKNKPYSGSFIVPDTKIVVANVSTGQFTAGGLGRTLVWSEDAPGGFVSESYRDEARRSNVLRVRMNTAEKVIDANAAVRITTTYS